MSRRWIQEPDWDDRDYDNPPYPPVTSFAVVADRRAQEEQPVLHRRRFDGLVVAVAVTILVAMIVAGITVAIVSVLP